MVHSEAVAQVGGECRVQRFAGADQGIVDGVASTAATHLLQETVEGFQVAFAQRSRVAVQMVDRFQSLEPRRAGERESPVRRRPSRGTPARRGRAVAAACSPRIVPLGSASRSETRTIIPRRGVVSATARKTPYMSVLSRGAIDVQRLDDRMEVISFAADGDLRANAFVERHATDGIVLLQHQIGQAGGDRAGVLVLVQRAAAVAPCCSRHRPATCSAGWCPLRTA